MTSPSNLNCSHCAHSITLGDLVGTRYRNVHCKIFGWIGASKKAEWCVRFVYEPGTR